MYQNEDKDGLHVCSFFFPSYFHCAIFLFSPPPSHIVEEVMARVYLEASVVTVDERLLLHY